MNRAKAAELLSKAVRHPAWKVPSWIVDTTDIAGSREDVLIEIAAEGAFEAGTRGLGYLGGRPLDAFRNRMHDQITGSKTEPQPDPRTPDSSQQPPPEPPIPGGVPDQAEGEAALDAKAGALEQFANAVAEGKDIAADGDLESRAFQEYESEYIPFFQRRAGQPAEAVKLLQESWQAGIFDPITALYDEIYAAVAETGLPPSQAHPKAEEQLRGELGPDLYARYRGSDYGVVPDLTAFEDFYMSRAGGNIQEATSLREADQAAGIENPIDTLYDRLHAQYENESPSVAQALAERDLRRELGEQLYEKYRTPEAPTTVADRVERAKDVADSVEPPTKGEQTDDAKTADTTTTESTTPPSTETSGKTTDTTDVDSTTDDGTPPPTEEAEQTPDDVDQEGGATKEADFIDCRGDDLVTLLMS